MGDNCWVCLNCNKWIEDDNRTEAPLCSRCGVKMISGYINKDTGLPVGMEGVVSAAKKTERKSERAARYTRRYPNWVRALGWIGFIIILKYAWYIILPIILYGYAIVLEFIEWIFKN